MTNSVLTSFALQSNFFNQETDIKALFFLAKRLSHQSVVRPIPSPDLLTANLDGA
jgi:hypothetical protein